MAPVHWAAGSDGETNFGVTSLAAPKAALSRVARYSFTARLAVPGSRVFCHSKLGIERCLLASATIRLASTANPSHRLAQPQYMPQQHARRRGGRGRCYGSVRCGPVRTPNDPG